MASHKIQVEHKIVVSDNNPKTCDEHNCDHFILESESNQYVCNLFRVRLQQIGVVRVWGYKRCKACLKKTGEY